MQTFNLTGTPRKNVGRTAAKDARNNDKIPCVLYGDGENIHFEVTNASVKNLVYTPNVYKVQLTIDGADHETLMREIQFHPTTDDILHIDFLKLKPGKTVTCTVPVVTEGQSAGVKAGGKLVQRLRSLTIKALPKNLIDHITIDVSNLEIGDTSRIGDIKIKDVDVLGSKSIPVVTIISPRALKAAQDAAASAEAPAPAATDAAKAAATEEKKD
ncbi:MAG: 50S ribosomal protein L25/general stress protein Ctc [Chitinophagales bacterium]